MTFVEVVKARGQADSMVGAFRPKSAGLAVLAAVAAYRQWSRTCGKTARQFFPKRYCAPAAEAGQVKERTCTFST